MGSEMCIRDSPRLDTLALIAKGLNCELMLVPSEKKQQVLAILMPEDEKNSDFQTLLDNPWQGILEDE